VRLHPRTTCHNSRHWSPLPQDFYEEEHTEILARAVWARKRPSLPWLFGSALSFAVGVALTMSANTTMMRAAILTDAATVADLLRSEFKLGIAPGEVIELFQLHADGRGRAADRTASRAAALAARQVTERSRCNHPALPLLPVLPPAAETHVSSTGQIERTRPPWGIAPHHLSGFRTSRPRYHRAHRR
jgi:hypothetical protein